MSLGVPVEVVTRPLVGDRAVSAMRVSELQAEVKHLRAQKQAEAEKGDAIYCEACAGSRFDRLESRNPLLRRPYLAVRCFYCNHWQRFPLGLITHNRIYGSYELWWIA